MTCQQVQHRMSQFWSHELPSDDEQAFAAHLRTCPICRREWEAFCEAMASLRQAQAPSAPADLPARIRTTLQRRQTRRRQVTRRWGWVAVGAVATLVVVPLMTRHWQPSSAPAPLVVKRHSAPPPPPPPARAPAPPSTTPKLAERLPPPRQQLLQRRSLRSGSEAAPPPHLTVPRRESETRSAPLAPGLTSPPPPPQVAQLPSEHRPSKDIARGADIPAPALAPSVPPATAMRAPVSPPLAVERQSPQQPLALSVPQMGRAASEPLNPSVQMRWARFEPARVGRVAVWQLALQADTPVSVSVWVQPTEGVEVPNALVSQGADQPGLLLWEGKVLPDKAASVPVLARPTQAGARRMTLTVDINGQHRQWLLVFAAIETSREVNFNAISLQQERWSLWALLYHLAWQIQGAFLVPHALADASVTVPTGTRTLAEVLNATAQQLGGRWLQTGAAFAFLEGAAQSRR